MTDKEYQALLEMKKDLVVNEVRRRADNQAGRYEQIFTFRQWELTLIAAILGFTTTQILVAKAAYLLPAIVILFALLELISRGALRLEHDANVELERLILSKDDVSSILDEYQMAAIRWEGTTMSQKVKATLRGAASANFLSWHLSVSAVSVILSILLV